MNNALLALLYMVIIAAVAGVIAFAIWSVAFCQQRGWPMVTRALGTFWCLLGFWLYLVLMLQAT